jgi:hypothetical protein
MRYCAGFHPIYYREPLPQIPTQLQDVLGKRQYATEAPKKEKEDISSLVQKIKSAPSTEEDEGEEEHRQLQGAQGNEVGVMVTLRGDVMYEFLDRLLPGDLRREP